jgi:SAM-dependent methyltransferase
VLPAAEMVVARAEPLAGKVVVDVGCGTGNAALLAASLGARVIGVDPAPRLLEVARAEAEARRLDVAFVPGDAAALPLEDASVDAVLSVFAVIFAPDVTAAAAELSRVTRNGPIVLTAWIPGGPISEVIRLGREALGARPGPPPFPWHEREALEGLFHPHGFGIEIEEHRLAFTGRSPSAYLDAEIESHPLLAAEREILERHGLAGDVRMRMLSVLEAANEDPTGFRVTRRYVVAAATR